MYRWTFKLKNLKRISKRDIAFWLFLTSLMIFIFIQAFFIPKYHVLDPIHEKSVVIDRIEIDRFHKRVILYADEQSYYMSYSSHYETKSIRKLRADLESGKLSVGDTADIKFISADDIAFNFILNKKRIVDFRTESEIYYTLDIQKKVLAESKIVMIIVFFPFLLVWLFFTLLPIFYYNIIKIQKQKTPPKKNN